MSPFLYTARELFDWLNAREEIVVVDVRNHDDFAKFKVEGPFPFTLLNIPYFDFMESEQDSLAQIPSGARVRIVCAKEASAKYVADIVAKGGFADVGYLRGGINSWGNLLVPRQLPTPPHYRLYQFIRPGKASCSYGLLYGGRMMLFDPSRNVEFYLDFAREHGAEISRTFETHLQADYIAGSRLIAERTGSEFFATEADFAGAHFRYHTLADGGEYGFPAPGPAVRAMFTPGHTPGSTTYVIDEKYLLTGDTVFIKSIGRPDLGGKAEEWSRQLFATMEAIKKLDHGLHVLPAHFIDWDEANQDRNFSCTLGEAIARNKAIYDIGNAARFYAFIQANMRPQPEEYKRIRLINANLEQADDEEQTTLDIGKNECAASAHAKLKAV